MRGTLSIGNVYGNTIRDHPRGCGEHPQQWQESKPYPGSSPRLRGTPDVSVIGLATVGIIPADAGNTTSKNPSVRLSWDHPRGCREHGYMYRRNESTPGSSPRMRGTPRSISVHCRPSRIIPADAGNTLRVGHGPGDIRDHPRGCGEHCRRPSLPLTAGGSSPRMRGTPFRHLQYPWIRRIIPADAGNTAPGMARM